MSYGLYSEVSHAFLDLLHAFSEVWHGFNGVFSREFGVLVRGENEFGVFVRVARLWLQLHPSSPQLLDRCLDKPHIDRLLRVSLLRVLLYEGHKLGRNAERPLGDSVSRLLWLNRRSGFLCF